MKQSGLRLKGEEIKDVATKFFFKEDKLHFQILLHLSKGEVLEYMEFDDYYQYKEAFQKVLDYKSRNDELIVPIKGDLNDGNLRVA